MLKCYICKKEIKKEFYLYDNKKICAYCAKRKSVASLIVNAKRVFIGV